MIHHSLNTFHRNYLIHFLIKYITLLGIKWTITNIIFKPVWKDYFTQTLLKWADLIGSPGVTELLVICWVCWDSSSTRTDVYIPGSPGGRRHFLRRFTLLTSGPGSKAGQFSSNDKIISEKYETAFWSFLVWPHTVD